MTAAPGPSLLAVGTAVPSHELSQPVLRDWFAEQEGIDRLSARLIRAVFDSSAIERRHTVIAGLAEPQEGLFSDAEGSLRSPGTRERNDLYRREAPALAAASASDALRRAGIAPAEVTHVVTVSCTGLFAPGPDFRLVRDLGIPSTVERFHLGFVGCAAAFPGLRAAHHICRSQPDAVVLVVCVELCSLHIRSSTDPEQIVASAVFADGAAAAVVSSGARAAEGPRLEIGTFSTTITSEGEADMDWSVGDHGFEMKLSAEVPRIVGREVRGAFAHAFGDDVAPVDAAEAWAVHPGGRSVLDRVQQGLELPEDVLDHSRAVLREYGNMSSATVLFILQRILDDEALAEGARVAGMAFGPGLTVETATFRRWGSGA
jgi:predicted naringenin-chalcone synthase